MKKVFCVMLSMVLLVGCFLIYPEGLYMSDPATSENDAVAIALVENGGYEPAGIENGSVYALQNVGSSLWASASLNTASYFYIWDLFQHTEWTNSAQTFKFVKTDTDENTYFIYPLEYNHYNSGETRALYCNYNKIESQQPSEIDVSYTTYSEAKRSGFEWIVEQKDGYVHTIRLKADPKYVLCAKGNTAGNENSYDNGNIVAYRQATTNSATTGYQEWKLTYVIQEQEYYIKNRALDTYIENNSSIIVNTFSGANSQKWHIDHYRNGIYRISPYTTSNSLYVASTIDCEDVTLSNNSSHPSSMWVIRRLRDGTFGIINSRTNSLGYDYTMQPYSKNNPQIINGTYLNDMYAEWFFIPTNGIYGMQTYRSNDNCLLFSNKSLAYALGLDSDDPDTFYSYKPNDYDEDDKEEYNTDVHEDFLDWISDNFSGRMTVEPEEDFSDNGANKQLAPNQFRVAMRTGVEDAKNLISNSIGNIIYIFAEYHFWYQTYDGRWAHVKDAPGNDAELFDVGITPQSTTGWDIADRYLECQISQNNSLIAHLTKSFFFDSELRVYIITVE